MAKFCCACNKPLGFFSDKVALKDGYLCKECQKAGGIPNIENSEDLYALRVAEIINAQRNDVQRFKATTHYSRLSLDTNSHSFILNGNFYYFKNLISFTYHEVPDRTGSKTADKDGKSTGAIIGSVIGGLSGGIIGGAVGAAVGGKIGSLFSETCDNLYITIKLKDSLVSNVQLNYITEKTKVSSDEYKSAHKQAQSCLEGLNIITEHNIAVQKEAAEKARREKEAAEKARQQANAKKDVFIQDKHFTASELANELSILQNLQFSGLLTQEEFEQKKKQLLELK